MTNKLWGLIGGGRLIEKFSLPAEIVPGVDLYTREFAEGCLVDITDKPPMQVGSTWDGSSFTPPAPPRLDKDELRRAAVAVCRGKSACLLNVDLGDAGVILVDTSSYGRAELSEAVQRAGANPDSDTFLLEPSGVLRLSGSQVLEVQQKVSEFLQGAGSALDRVQRGIEDGSITTYDDIIASEWPGSGG